MRALAAGAVAVVILGGSAAASRSAPNVPVASAAKITFVNVGEGDGVVMKVGEKVIVSDAGEYNLDDLNAALRALGAERIDVAILSHPHEDHVKNFIKLFAQWTVKQAVMSRSAYWQGTKTNRAVMKAIKDEGLDPAYVKAGQSFSWGGASWQILNPFDNEYTGGKDDAANSSVAYLLTVNGEEALFTGDIDKAVSLDLAARLPKLHGRLDILLATHHGSRYASPKELLALTRPRYAVLSVGPNGYGHPTPETVAALKAVSATIWCTAEMANGTTTVAVFPSGWLSWSGSKEKLPWWSAKTKKETGTCVDR
jgi:competence protein ComEC